VPDRLRSQIVCELVHHLSGGCLDQADALKKKDPKVYDLLYRLPAAAAALPLARAAVFSVFTTVRLFRCRRTARRHGIDALSNMLR
jgi:hypothetical protein